jgi:hypothetical protein
LDSPKVTDNNKANLTALVQKLPEKDLEEKYLTQIKNKNTCQKSSTVD